MPTYTPAISAEPKIKLCALLSLSLSLSPLEKLKFASTCENGTFHLKSVRQTFQLSKTVQSSRSRRATAVAQLPPGFLLAELGRTEGEKFVQAEHNGFTR